MTTIMNAIGMEISRCYDNYQRLYRAFPQHLNNAKVMLQLDNNRRKLHQSGLLTDEYIINVLERPMNNSAECVLNRIDLWQLKAHRLFLSLSGVYGHKVAAAIHRQIGKEM